MQYQTRNETKTNYMDLLKLKKAYKVAKLMNRRKVKQIIDFLNEIGCSSVTDITNRLRCDQCETSFFLSLMEKAGIVHSIRKGKYVFYVLNLDKLELVASAVSEFSKPYKPNRNQSVKVRMVPA